MDITTEPFSMRRTVYGFIERQNLPGLFRTFDFASPDTTSSQRFSTTVPQQALFMINSPFVVQQAWDLLKRPEVKSERRPKQRIKALYQIAFQRAPRADEVQLALGYLERQAAAPPREAEVPTWQYGYGEYDNAAQRAPQFQPLPHFTGQTWQGGDKLPDDKLGWVLLNAEGGHAKQRSATCGHPALDCSPRRLSEHQRRTEHGPRAAMGCKDASFPAARVNWEPGRFNMGKNRPTSHGWKCSEARRSTFWWTAEPALIRTHSLGRP